MLHYAAEGKGDGSSGVDGIATSHRPRPSNLMARDDDCDAEADDEERDTSHTNKEKGAAGQLYRAPRLQAVPYHVCEYIVWIL